jgi:myo-inositol-1(or 4)-monophosphatase
LLPHIEIIYLHGFLKKHRNNSDMNIERICSDAIDIVRKTGDYISSELENREADINFQTKGLHNFVTYVDKTSEKMLIDGLSKLIPESGFIAEEGTNAKRGEVYNWIIDPLDGTTNYIHALPPYAISVGLMREKEVIAGVIYELSLKECFYAWEGSTAYMNGKEIKVSNAPTLNDSLIATGFPYYNYEYLTSYLETIRYFMKNCHGLRRLGSAATDLAYVACGRFEAFYEYGLNPWDVAAGVIILKQAGGRVTDFTEGDNYIFGREIVATNTKIHQEFLTAVRGLMGK